ncbi:MAG: hypothetical protein U9Q66_04535 [Patescibacteria group bacterium]|nr:hypothetical protein [Patescibacteria group bacterium]
MACRLIGVCPTVCVSVDVDKRGYLIKVVGCGDEPGFETTPVSGLRYPAGQPYKGLLRKVEITHCDRFFIVKNFSKQ